MDTTRLSDGDHTIQVKVIDAAGNLATVYGPAPFAVDNSVAVPTAPLAGPANGDNASETARLRVEFRRSRSRTYRASFGRRVVIRGRLVNERGQGIGNALIEIRGGRSRAAGIPGAVRTGPDGSFAVTLASGVSSASLRFSYRAHLSDPREAASATLTLRVRAGIKLSVSPRTVHNHEAIVFRGRLLGRPVPKGGKLVEMQVRYPTGWRTFATVRTSRRGSFRYRYRFMRSFEPITYKFRVRARRESGYPFDTGASRVLRVRVR